MTGGRLFLAALVLLAAAAVLPGRSAGAEPCTDARALELWAATASRLGDLLGGPVPPPPRIVIHGEARDLPHPPGREPGLAVIGTYDRASREMHVSCADGTAPVFEATVRHESTHDFLHTGIGRIPRWLDEGLAAVMEAGSLKEGAPADHVNEPRLREYVDMLKFGLVPRVAEVMGGKPLALKPSQEYATYWALVFTLLHHSDPDVQERRRALLRRLMTTAAESGGNPIGAVERGFFDYVGRDGVDPHDWEMRWHREIWALR